MSPRASASRCAYDDDRAVAATSHSDGSIVRHVCLTHAQIAERAGVRVTWWPSALFDAAAVLSAQAQATLSAAAKAALVQGARDHAEQAQRVIDAAPEPRAQPVLRVSHRGRVVVATADGQAAFRVRLEVDGEPDATAASLRELLERTAAGAYRLDWKGDD